MSSLSSTRVENRIRQFLLAVVGFLCLGTMVELWLTKHTQEAPQFIPFGLCTLGFVTVVAVLVRPRRSTILLLRVVMVLLALGSLLGIFLHVRANYEFIAEIRPNAAPGDVLLMALQGAAPLLAPGLLAIMAGVAFIATYYHPALRKNTGPADMAGE
jgi:glucan phosphoethanolaminetransferase (alkaline phosphatase superfamily)